MLTGVGVEKLFPAKFAKIKSCQDAPQTTFSVFLDTFYPPNSCCFEENGVFQQPRPFTTTTLVTSVAPTTLRLNTDVFPANEMGWTACVLGARSRTRSHRTHGSIGEFGG